MVMARIEGVRDFRMNSTKEATRKSAITPTLFQEIRQPISEYIIVPRVSSETRKYVPMGFMNPEIIINDAVQIIPNALLYHFGVLTSNVHMAWMRAVCGRLETRYRYSKDIVYNNFPWPAPTEEQKTKLLAEHNFIPDFSQQTNRLLENAQAQQELEKQNQQEASEPTTIPASESVTGEEIVVTPEEKEAVAEPVEISVAEPTLRQRTENAIRARLESGKKGKKKTSGLKLLSDATKRVRSGKGTTKDYAVFFRSNLNLTEAQAKYLKYEVSYETGESINAKQILKTKTSNLDKKMPLHNARAKITSRFVCYAN